MSESKETSAEDDITNSYYEDLLRKAIRKHSGNAHLTVKVKDIQDVVPTGNNYLSRLHRVFIAISRGNQIVEEKILIVKIFPKGEILQKFIKEEGIFENEIKMYTKILPEMNIICLDTLGLTFGARSFDAGEDNLLILEDLKVAGYKMANRQAGLDIDHCKMAIRTLARFHAVSVALLKADISYMDMFPGRAFHKDKVEAADKFLRPQYNELSEIVETWPGFERFGEKLRDAGSIAAEKMSQLNDPTRTELAVVNHGDFWLNNMLFKYSDTGELEDVKFVDFQMTRFASPAIDLHYFLVTSPNDAVRYEGIDMLIELYHSELSDTLEAVGCGDKTVTYEWVKEEMKDKMFFAVNTACTVLSLIRAENDNVPDFSEIKEDYLQAGGKSVMYKSYNGASYRNVLQKLLLIFEKEGVL